VKQPRVPDDDVARSTGQLVDPNADAVDRRFAAQTPLEPVSPSGLAEGLQPRVALHVSFAHAFYGLQRFTSLAGDELRNHSMRAQENCGAARVGWYRREEAEDQRTGELVRWRQEVEVGVPERGGR